ncbi:major facilitator superfamily domain-containing protein [Mucor mucedo]|uniref:major facilitator superfamily domain-containing protein n=1 Tax=Mucor mucedo TaxID=29922 RepID=UPI0022212387|nr:major facilitator superfamily domain-containing protein [Mucor mucedo]KAI7870105.1 major facilitator superfamily domain-containing protein [Mucor mucedo]
MSSTLPEAKCLPIPKNNTASDASQDPNCDSIITIDNPLTANASEEHDKTNTTSPDTPYSILTARKKAIIVVIISLSSFVSAFSANIYYPALKVIQNDLNITERMVYLTVTVYMIFQGLSPSFWGSLADSWGRRPVYIMTFLIYIFACIGLACTKNYVTLLILRMLQAFGSSSAIAVGAGIIGDIATPMERGGYMGLFSMGTMLGPLLGPVLGGIVSYRLGWRWIFWVLSMLVTPLWFAIVLFLPETLRALVGDGSGYANPTPLQYWRRERKIASKQLEDIEKPPRSRFLVLPNPFQSWVYLKERVVLIILLYNSLQYAGLYCVITSVTDLFSNAYGINEVQVGLCFLSNGVGASLGSYTSGRILDWRFKTIAKSLGIDEKNANSNIPEDFPIKEARMGITWIWGIAFNVAMIAYGWSLFYKIHIAVPIILNFILSFTATSTFNATNTLLIDLFPNNSAAIIGSNNLTRCLLGAGAVLTVQPGVHLMGIGWFFTAMSLFLLITRVTMAFLCFRPVSSKKV